MEVTIIATQNKVASNVASTLLSEISMYPGILEEQLLQLHPKKEDQIINLLSYLQKNKRIQKDTQKSYYPINSTLKSEREVVIRCVWVLLEFMPNVEYHTASDYPVAIDLFTNGEEYQIIYVAEGSESLISAVLGQQKDLISKKMVLVDSPEQIPLLLLPGVVGYCTATTSGCVTYYKLK